MYNCVQRYLNMGSKNQFGKILKTARLKAEMTQAQVAEKAGITTNYYARIERGEVSPTVEVIDSVVKALGIQINFPLKQTK